MRGTYRYSFGTPSKIPYEKFKTLYVCVKHRRIEHMCIYGSLHIFRRKLKKQVKWVISELGGWG